MAPLFGAGGPMQLSLQRSCRPRLHRVLRPAKGAGHQEDTAVDYIESQNGLMLSLLRAVMVARQNNLYQTSRPGGPVTDLYRPGVRFRDLTA